MIRAYAEWEEQECVLVVFPHAKSDWNAYLEDIQKSYITFIKAISHFQICLVLCYDKDVQKLVPKDKNIKTLLVKTDDTWIRDFGAIDAQIDKKTKSYKFTFNAWGGKFEASLDNKAAYEIAKYFDERVLEQNFILEGGSIDANGNGAMITTKNCIFNQNRNKNLTQNEITKKLKDLFGLEKLIVLEHGFIQGDDTDSHVDILARFIDQNTIAYVSCEDENDIHFEELKKMEKELIRSGFSLLALPLPKPMYFKSRRLGGTYLNFLFVNGGLIVPTYGQKSDDVALCKLSNALPHLEIKGVDARVFLRQNGSLHCASINRFLRR